MIDNNTFHKIPVTFFEESYNKYQNEVMNLLHFIRLFHPVSIVNPERVNRFERQAEKICHEMKGVIDLQHFQFALNSLLAILEDAHTYFMPEDGLIYPYEIRYYEGCFYLYAIDSEYPDFTGKEIVSINDISVKDVRLAMRKAMPSENGIKAGLWSFYLNRKALLHQMGVDTAKGVCLGFHDGSSLLFEPETDNRSGWYQVKFPPHPVTVKRDDLFSYQIIEDKCYLQFNVMYDLQSYLQLCQVTGTKIEDNYLNFLPSFSDFIDKMDADLKQHHIRKLVVDMRYNGGGNSMLGDQLLQYLGVDTDSIIKYKTFVRKSDFLFKCMPKFYVSSKSKSGELVLMEDFENLPFLPKIKNHFEGKVIFIQGQNTFSSANYLLTTIKDNHLFTIIGTPTSQKPTCFGDVLPVELPFTGTKGYISHSFFERPDVSRNEEDCLYPDFHIPVSMNERLKGIDKCWEWVEMNLSDESIIV